MKKTLKGFVLGVIITTILMGTVMGAGTKDVIEVLLNSVNLSVNGTIAGKVGANYTLDNGEKVPYSILYKGTTYLPIRKVSEILDKEVGWDGNTSTVSISDKKDIGVKKDENITEFNNATKETIIGKWKMIGYYDRDGKYIKEDNSPFELTFLSDGIHYDTLHFPAEGINLMSKYKYEVVNGKILLIDVEKEYDSIDPIEIKISRDGDILHYYVGTGVIRVYEIFK